MRRSSWINTNSRRQRRDGFVPPACLSSFHSNGGDTILGRTQAPCQSSVSSVRPMSRRAIAR